MRVAPRSLVGARPLAQVAAAAVGWFFGAAWTIASETSNRDARVTLDAVNTHTDPCQPTCVVIFSAFALSVCLGDYEGLRVTEDARSDDRPQRVLMGEESSLFHCVRWR